MFLLFTIVSYIMVISLCIYFASNFILDNKKNIVFEDFYVLFLKIIKIWLPHLIQDEMKYETDYDSVSEFLQKAYNVHYYMSMKEERDNFTRKYYVFLNNCVNSLQVWQVCLQIFTLPYEKELWQIYSEGFVLPCIYLCVKINSKKKIPFCGKFRSGEPTDKNYVIFFLNIYAEVNVNIWKLCHGWSKKGAPYKPV